MPISIDMLRSHSDYTELEGLHVYGDFFNLYSLAIPNITITEVEQLYSNLKNLDGRILTMYVSYFLSKAGFSPSELYDPGEGNGEEVKLDTTKFECQDWIDNAVLFDYSEEGLASEWWLDFENEKGQSLRIFFLTLIHSDEDPVTGKIDEATYVLKLIEKSFGENKGQSVIVVHPRIYKKAKETFNKTKTALKRITGCDLLLSTNQFAYEFIRDDAARETAETEWELLRGKLLENFQEEFPFLIYAIHERQLAKSREQLRKARIKFEMGNDFDGAITESAVACERLLNVLHSVYMKEVQSRVAFDRYLCDLSEEITEDYGEDILNDLKLIRDWRNKVVHGSEDSPDMRTALKVLSKAELFLRLFDENYRLKILKKHNSGED